jgi:uncharacterized protein with HEPN domain
MTSAKHYFRLVDYLGHMLEAIEHCQDYVVDMDGVAFLSDRKTQDAVIRTFEVIGEAANNIRKYHPDFVTAYPEVPFNRAVGMRNVLSHGYFSVDLEAVWLAIHADLPPLYQALRALIDSLDPDPS